MYLPFIGVLNDVENDVLTDTLNDIFTFLEILDYTHDVLMMY
jgi:hypothetical protein